MGSSAQRGSVSQLKQGMARLVERLVLNDALADALTFSHALLSALSWVNLSVGPYRTLSQIRSTIAVGVQNRCRKAVTAFLGEN
jgi:hypothetical protein